VASSFPRPFSFPPRSRRCSSPRSAVVPFRASGSHRSQFLVVVRVFVHIAFQIAIHFHRFHLKRIQN
jgi:hypothetical protein